MSTSILKTSLKVYAQSLVNRPLRLIVAGGRDYNSTIAMVEYLDLLDLPDDTELVCGMAKGADRLARHLWLTIGTNKVHEFEPNWNRFGKSAGYRRNAEMGQFADALVAFWDGKSRGTNHMIEEMGRLNKPTFICRY